MIEYFRRRYKKKTKAELEAIVSSHTLYQKEAVQAAMELLANKFDTQVGEIEFEEDKHTELPEEEITEERVGNRHGLYFRTFSLREPTSAIVLALFYFSILRILDYCSEENWLINHYRMIEFMFFASVGIINHIFYKKEHGRSNLFWGRTFQVLLTGVFVLAISTFRLWVNGSRFIDADELLSMTFAVLLISLVTELILSVLRRILLFFKWQTW